MVVDYDVSDWTEKKEIEIEIETQTMTMTMTRNINKLSPISWCSVFARLRINISKLLLSLTIENNLWNFFT